MIVYTLKTALCLMAFMCVYELLLRRLTTHRLNRCVLLAVMAASLVLPAVQLTLSEPSALAQGMIEIEGLEELSVKNAELQMTKDDGLMSNAVWPFALARVIYIIGIVLMAVRLLWQLAEVAGILMKHRVTETKDGVRIIVAPKGIPSFSWFRFVVVNESDYQEHAAEVMTHELAHARQWHSLDALLCDLLCVFQWFNPAAWLLRRDLREVHEYEADEKVISRGIDSKQYQMLLIRRTVGECAFALANSFNQKSLKRRITMMKKQKTNGWQSLRALALLPVGALAVVAFAHPSVSKVEQAVEEVAAPVQVRNAEKAAPVEAAAAPVEMKQTATEVKTDTISQEKTYDVVEEMPQFPGGISALGIWMGENIKYPQSCVDQGIEGRVIVTFVVDKSGEVRDAKVMRSIAPELDAEALRVVMAMPRWTPGKQSGEAVNVKYTIPLSFKIPESDKQENKELEN